MQKLRTLVATVLLVTCVGALVLLEVSESRAAGLHCSYSITCTDCDPPPLPWNCEECTVDGAGAYCPPFTSNCDSACDNEYNDCMTYCEYDGHGTVQACTRACNRVFIACAQACVPYM